MKVYLVSFVGMNLDNDSAVLIKALEKREIESQSVGWDDPSVDWDEPDLCIIKSASNYVVNPKPFIEWTRKIEKKCILWNSGRLVEWNHDKHYLKDLNTKGVPMPPSLFVDKESERMLSQIMEVQNWDEVVIKPTISAGSFGLRRFKSNSPEAEQYLQDLTTKGFYQTLSGVTWSFAACDAIVQPYIPEIVNGEVSLFYFSGEFSHAVIKKAKAGDFRSHPIWNATVERHQVSLEELIVGEVVLKAMEATEYARVDLVNTPKGPLIIEVELIEPFMFFDMFPETAEVFADHIKRSL